MKPLFILPLLLISLLTSHLSNAEVLWSDVSVSLLKGNNYQVGNASRTVFTFEHAAGYSWGDSFMFVDRLHSANGDKETYAEISPRFTLTSHQNSVIKHTYIATTAEIGDGFTHYLYGVGAALNVPHFNFVNINLYHRNNDSGDNGKQLTATWALPLGPFTYDGFIDYVPSTNEKRSSMNLTSQLKYDLAGLFNLKTKLYIGVEYVYWRNKFGINNINEKNVNMLVKYHF